MNSNFCEKVSLDSSHDKILINIRLALQLKIFQKTMIFNGWALVKYTDPCQWVMRKEWIEDFL